MSICFLLEISPESVENCLTVACLQCSVGADCKISPPSHKLILNSQEHFSADTDQWFTFHKTYSTF